MSCARGAWPVGLRRHYPPDHDNLKLYADVAALDDGFATYLDLGPDAECV